MSAALAKATFDRLTAIHAVLGDEMPCDWPAYRETMTGFYGLNGGMLDSMHRLGYIRATETGVRFSQ